ncbi:MAG: adenylate/guanylate cyclase domain-containing protein [Pseudomonadales bacterium]
MLRCIGFSVLALALLLHTLSGAALAGPFHWLTIAFLLAWPWLLWASGVSPGHVDYRPLWLEPLESLVVMLLLLRCGFDSWHCSCALAALLLCHLAQSGASAALASAVGAALGIALALALQSVPGAATYPVVLAQFPGSPAVLLLLALVWVLAVTFTLLGFRRSVRLHGAKRQLQILNQRLARYLPAELPERLGPAPEQPPLIVRRWVTVVFVDLCDFSATTQQLAPEALQRVLNDYVAQLDQSCSAAQASLSKVIGDGALLLFESPAEAHRAPAARRALTLCRRLPDALAQLAQQWRSVGILAPLKLRCGVASGYCSVGDWGRARLDYTVMGEAVNLAARLQHSARPGSVLLDEATAALVAPQVRVSAPVRWQFKGLGNRLVFELLVESSVDRARRSAIVPSDFAVPVATAAPAVAQRKTPYDRQQTVPAGRSRRAH